MIDFAQLETDLGTVGTQFLAVIKPYLPALAREGQDIYDGFISSLVHGDMIALDTLMFPKMTPEERTQLESDVYQDAYTAVQNMIANEALMKEIALKLAVSLLTKLI